MDTNKFKQKLEKEKQDILKELETHKGVVDFGSDVDPDEETDESEEYSNEMSISQTLKSVYLILNQLWKKSVMVNMEFAKIVKRNLRGNP